jgi:DNA-binding NarL/FixJ family response regulator
MTFQTMKPIHPPNATAERPVTVMLVDDHASFRASARWLLETEGYVVVAEAASGESALETVGDVQPELVLLDVGLPGIDGFQVALGIRARCSGTRIVLTSSRDLADLGADRVSACGAAGFVHKAALSRAAIAAATA